jgi:hypothetical protein
VIEVEVVGASALDAASLVSLPHLQFDRGRNEANRLGRIFADHVDVRFV